jgi:hypothetical protein
MSKFVEFNQNEIEEALNFIIDEGFKTPEEAQEHRLKYKNKFKSLQQTKTTSIKTLEEIGESLGYSLTFKYTKQDA